MFASRGTWVSWYNFRAFVCLILSVDLISRHPWIFLHSFFFLSFSYPFLLALNVILLSSPSFRIPSIPLHSQ